jgi:hypothetical protein
MKIYCHYNFTTTVKKNDEDSWTSKLYFAEAKVIHGVKYYFCSLLLPIDDGICCCLFVLIQTLLFKHHYTCRWCVNTY